MKKIHLIGICMILLALFMTACGGYENAALDDSWVSKPPVQQSQSAETTQDGAIPSADAEDPSQGAEIPSTDAEDPSQDETDVGLPVYGEYYYDLVNVVLYLEEYDELPANYITKTDARALGWEGGSVENYREGAAIGGDYFGNREGLLPAANGRSYTECDIDTNGYSSRGSRRLVFSNDGLYFYTSDHYESFSEVIVTEDHEVIW